jgi:hypothetical protein
MLDLVASHREELRSRSYSFRTLEPRPIYSFNLQQPVELVQQNHVV